MAADPLKHRMSCPRLTGAILPRQTLPNLDVARAIQQKQKPRAPKTTFEQPAAAARNAGLQALGFPRAGTVLNSMP